MGELRRCYVFVSRYVVRFDIERDRFVEINGSPAYLRVSDIKASDIEIGIGVKREGDELIVGVIFEVS